MNSRNFKVVIADSQDNDRFLTSLVVRKRIPQLTVVAEIANGEKLFDYLAGQGDFTDRDRHPLPDLLILNMRLPLRDGFSILQWLKGQPLPPIKVAALVAPQPETDAEQARLLGADHVFCRAGNLDGLEQQMRTLVELLEEAQPRA